MIGCAAPVTQRARAASSFDELASPANESEKSTGCARDEVLHAEDAALVGNFRRFHAR